MTVFAKSQRSDRDLSRPNREDVLRRLRGEVQKTIETAVAGEEEADDDAAD